MTNTFDVVIAGGGVVGCAAALAITNSTNLSVAVIESHPPEQSDIHPSFDARVIALAHSSLQCLRDWQFDISKIDGGDIKRIHVSDRKHIAQVVLDAAEIGVDALGKVVHLEQLGLALLSSIDKASVNNASVKNTDASNNQLKYFCPETIQAVQKHQETISLTTSERSLTCKLLVIAEGAQSSTRTLAGMDVQTDDYEQTAIVTNVTTELAHNNCAYERFTQYGPLAFLPMHDSFNTQADGSKQRLMSVVWTTSHAYAARLSSVADEAFLAELNSLFGSRLGKLEACTSRYQYPLMLRQASNFVSHRSICIGNAAQSLHPIAGQGFNLGVRDIQALVKVLKGSQDAGDFSTVQAYKAERVDDKAKVIGATDLLVRGFSNHYAPFVIARNKALFGLNMLSPLKNKFARFAMGQR
jgi:2-octaprenyl-6-methoxyphenol hydroxylase